jgi:hypothetical protein
MGLDTVVQRTSKVRSTMSLCPTALLTGRQPQQALRGPNPVGRKAKRQTQQGTRPGTR